MLYIEVIREAGKVVSAKITDDHYNSENRNDWKSFEAAQEVAETLGEGYVATDAGAYVSPRYDVIALPKVGDDVSYGFNGDYYPCGKVTKIVGKNFRKVVTSDGSVFWRRKLSGSWIKNGTWSLVSGVINKRNPEF